MYIMYVNLLKFSNPVDSMFATISRFSLFYFALDICLIDLYNIPPNRCVCNRFKI